MSGFQANSVRIVILIVVSAALALGSLWFVQVMQHKSEDMFPAKQRTEPDYYVEKFNFVRTGPNGDAHYTLSGTRMTHNPQDDSYFIDNPVMHSYSNTRPPMLIRSDTATVENDSTEVHMHDNVLVDRPAGPNSPHFQLKSNYLLALPDEDIVKTPNPVQIVQGTSTLTGTGMFANNATGEFRLSGNVHGHYIPAATQ
ncbi:MAG TPA: LPS export ABC transporter periplasmic protein LptC [Oxalicibacterium sp.]|nr:LPS export ABC transporter periplasmic protein LptC [Oxalicibacterium sp.]